MFLEKTILVTGIANQYSIAYGVAKELNKQGASLILCFQNDRFKKKAERFLEEFSDSEAVICDFTNDKDLKNLEDFLSARKTKLTGMVHSIAFAPSSSFEDELVTTSMNDFGFTMNSSVYTFLAASNLVKNFMTAGGSIVTMTFQASQRVVPDYKVMALAKAALETAVKYVAHELGGRKIRVNALSPGPIKTLASSGVGNINETLKRVESSVALKENIDLSDIAEFTAFLLSEKSKRVTGGIHFVDSGLNIY